MGVTTMLRFTQAEYCGRIEQQAITHGTLVRSSRFTPVWHNAGSAAYPCCCSAYMMMMVLISPVCVCMQLHLRCTTALHSSKLLNKCSC